MRLRGEGDFCAGSNGRRFSREASVRPAPGMAVASAQQYRGRIIDAVQEERKSDYGAVTTLTTPSVDVIAFANAYTRYTSGAGLEPIGRFPCPGRGDPPWLDEFPLQGSNLESEIRRCGNPIVSRRQAPPASLSQAQRRRTSNGGAVGRGVGFTGAEGHHGVAAGDVGPLVREAGTGIVGRGSAVVCR